MRVNRRSALGLLGLGALPVAGEASAQGAAFAHGVASGDPLDDRVILWTRVTAPEGANPTVRWEVAEDEGFARVVAKGSVTAPAARDHTVKVDAAGLKPGRDYWYRFTAGEVRSPIGRTRTLPKGPTPDVVLAVASCSLHPGGLFNAYAAIADLERVDAVVHLGDYIYEYGAAADDYGMKIGAQLGRIPEPAHEIVSLADYRRRHAQYKADADLQAAHARAPWICVWDDHETANDGWLSGAENHQPNEGDWATRKAAGLRAYFEWMPIREAAPGRAAEAIQRSFDFGDLATLLMVETRLQARAEALDLARDLKMVAGPDGKPLPDVQGFAARLRDPSRQLMGQEQEAWLGRELKRSKGTGRRWQLLGNQVVMARTNVPDAEKLLGGERFAQVLAGLAPEVAERVRKSVALAPLNLPMNLDAWDGYPAARERVYGLIKAANASAIALAGDSHAFWVNTLKDMAGERVAAEFGTTAITSPSWGDSMPGFDLGESIAAGNDEVVFSDQNSKGFIRLTLTADAAVGELIAVSTVTEKPFTTRTVATYRVERGADGAIGEPVAV